MEDARKTIELEQDAFREIPKGPLGNPRLLKRWMLFLAFGTCLCAYGAWQIGTWWSAFLPAGPAMWFGILWAGLTPRAFFTVSGN